MSAGETELELIGAGDQGMMFGYACNETPELMPLCPLPWRISWHGAWQKCVSEGAALFASDGKTQVTVQYVDGRPVGIKTVVIAAQHREDVALERIKDDIIETVIREVIPVSYLSAETNIYVNPTGRFVVGGPQGDAGLTGRKIIVDTYGGYARHGGGAFSGKDPTKVDRSGAYAARYVAKNVVAAGLADKCEVQLAYAIGVARPVSLLVETFGTAKIAEEKIEALVNRHFDLRPGAIINDLQLRRPIYQQVAAYGHLAAPI